jgi:hypothetical protein
MQNALILNLIIFLAGVTVHNIILTDFSYENILVNMINIYMLPGMLSYFALGNSSAIITGLLVVFVYTAVYFLAKLLVGIKHPNELVARSGLASS